jgi:hypothetical protein
MVLSYLSFLRNVGVLERRLVAADHVALVFAHVGVVRGGDSAALFQLRELLLRTLLGLLRGVRVGDGSLSRLGSVQATRTVQR